MTANEKVAQRKLSMLELAQELRSVSEACRLMGYSRSQFYEIKRAFQTGVSRVNYTRGRVDSLILLPKASRCLIGLLPNDLKEVRREKGDQQVVPAGVDGSHTATLRHGIQAGESENPGRVRRVDRVSQETRHPRAYLERSTHHGGSPLRQAHLRRSRQGSADRALGSIGQDLRQASQSGLADPR